MAPLAKATYVGTSPDLPPAWSIGLLEKMEWPDGCEPVGLMPAAPHAASCHEALFPSQTAADGTLLAATQQRLRPGFVEYSLLGKEKGVDVWPEVGHVTLAAPYPNFTLQPPAEWAGAIRDFDRDSILLAFWIKVPQAGPHTLYLTSRDGRPSSSSDVAGGVWIDDELVMTMHNFDTSETSAKVGATLGKGWHRICVSGSQGLGRDGDGRAATRAFTLYMKGPSDTAPVQVTPYAEAPAKG
ncbi:hypothetical protein [Dyella jiangningensis]